MQVVPDGLLAAAPSTAGWVLLGVAGLVLSGLFAGLETGFYALSRLRLQLRSYQKDAAAQRISGWMERPTSLLTGLLVWQNISNFAASAAITMLLSSQGLGALAQTALSALVISPFMLIFAEVVPKDLFYMHTDSWTYKLAGFLHGALLAITVVPVLPLLYGLEIVSTKLLRFGRGAAEAPSGTPHRVQRLVEESSATGLISDAQQDMIERTLRMAHIDVREVMIPWVRVVAVPAQIGQKGFEAIARRYNVSRLPVLGRNTNDILGVVQVVDVLADEKAFDLRPHLRAPITLLPEQSVRSAITLMQRARQTIGIVVNRQGQAVGLVTIKDLVEELVGELADW